MNKVLVIYREEKNGWWFIAPAGLSLDVAWKQRVGWLPYKNEQLVRDKLKKLQAASEKPKASKTLKVLGFVCAAFAWMM